MFSIQRMNLFIYGLPVVTKMGLGPARNCVLWCSRIEHNVSKTASVLAHWLVYNQLNMADRQEVLKC